MLECINFHISFVILQNSHYTYSITKLNICCIINMLGMSTLNRYVESIVSCRSTMVGCRGLALLFLAVSLCTHASALMPDSLTIPVTVCGNDNARAVFREKILFPKSDAVVRHDFAGNRTHIDSISSFLSNADNRNLLNVQVTGLYSPEGEYHFNIGLARARARAMVDLIKEFNPGIAPVTDIRHPSKAVSRTDYAQYRCAELEIVYSNNTEADGTKGVGFIGAVTDRAVVPDSVGPDSPALSDALICDTATAVSDSVISGCTAVESAGALPVTDDENVFIDNLFATTNMLYDGILIPNIGLGLRLSKRLTLQADWMYGRLSQREKRRYGRIYGGDIELRYRIGIPHYDSPLKGHYIGIYASLACYDFQTGFSHPGILSDKFNYAVGLSYTFSLPVSTHFNIDFNIGLGYLWGTYKKYVPIDNCDVWLSTHKLNWVGPTRVGISLVWLIGNDLKNNRKGGRR